MKEDVIETTPKPNPLTTVTPFSKALAVILFITLPFVGFYLGRIYQNRLNAAQGVSYFDKYQIPEIQTSPQPETTTSALPSPETSNWQVLINKTYGFSLKYPPTLKAEGEGIPPDDAKTSNDVIISSIPFQAEISVPMMKIMSYEKIATVNKGLSLREIAQADYDANKNNPYMKNKMISNLGSINFAGVPAFTFKMISDGFGGATSGFPGFKGENKVIEVENKGVVYLLFYSSTPTFEQIASTFKFLD